jgi:hypothetical protein
MTSHTTNSKTPTDQALEPSAGPAHHDAAILRQPGGQQPPQNPGPRRPTTCICPTCARKYQPETPLRNLSSRVRHVGFMRSVQPPRGFR